MDSNGIGCILFLLSVVLFAAAMVRIEGKKQEKAGPEGKIRLVHSRSNPSGNLIGTDEELEHTLVFVDGGFHKTLPGRVSMSRWKAASKGLEIVGR